MKRLLIVAVILLVAACSATTPPAPVAVAPTSFAVEPTATQSASSLTSTSVPSNIPTSFPTPPTQLPSPTLAPASITSGVPDFQQVTSRLLVSLADASYVQSDAMRMSSAAPFNIASLERASLGNKAGVPVAWSPDGRSILYIADTRDPNMYEMYIFDTHTRQSRIVVHDASSGFYTRQFSAVWPIWNDNQDAIVYPRKRTDGTNDIVAITPQGKLLRTFVAHVPVVDHNYGFDAYPSNAPGSLSLNVSIASNGRVGLLRERDILSMRLGEKDQTIPLAPSALQRLQQQTDRDYHQLWLAPDGIHYALAVTRTLSIYSAQQIAPLLSFERPELDLPGDKAALVRLPVLDVISSLKWSPNSRAFLYAVLDTRGGFGSYTSDWYAQTVSSGSVHQPPADDLANLARNVNWSPDSRWVVASKKLFQCPSNCLYTQIIVEPFTSQASMIWAGTEFGLNVGVWSLDGKRIAFGCGSQVCILTLEHRNP